jgi:hypothetical protein
MDTVSKAVQLDGEALGGVVEVQAGDFRDPLQPVPHRGVVQVHHCR